jgi:FkbM family methyltransferase
MTISRNSARPAAFILVSSEHGTLIVNRNDYRMVDEASGYGVGLQILTSSCMDPEEIDLALTLIESRRANFGDGVIAVDCGANIGVHTVEWARLMTGWGRVYSFEAQEKIYYALAGNIVINNCLNVTAVRAALGARPGKMPIPEPDYLIPSSYGSLELRKSPATEFIGQDINYDTPGSVVDVVSIDSLSLERLDFLKIDVEGMELDVLDGAARSIRDFQPQLLVEVIKSDEREISRRLQKDGYRIYPMGMNILATHSEDPITDRLKIEGGRLFLS